MRVPVVLTCLAARRSKVAVERTNGAVRLLSEGKEHVLMVLAASRTCLLRNLSCRGMTVLANGGC